MNRIRKITFINHPILGNIELDFCDSTGQAVDTLILAGENGTGKSTVLECLYKIASGTMDSEAIVEIEYHGQICALKYKNEMVSGKEYIFVRDNNGLHTTPDHNSFFLKYQISGIFSDVDINFSAQEISSVTSMMLDEKKDSRRSTNKLPSEIKQLLIDIQAMDDAELSRTYRNAANSGVDTNSLNVNQRIPRFTTAFNHMFSNLTYNRVENTGNHKAILFKKDGVDIPIDKLSSGEKQIVYRGCFLLKDANALNGTFVFIDEPEISLHPSWQQKILEYYKGIFSDENGQQTSQIFVVTHSPFIIHNRERKNDKVIIMQRDRSGNIIISDKPEYYKCESIEVIEDAFHVSAFSPFVPTDVPTIYLEGRTDEKYFTKALEVFGYIGFPFRFKWVGYIDDKGQEANTGKDSLNKAAQFLIAKNSPITNVCLFDCDTSRNEMSKNNVSIKVVPYYRNIKHMEKGIENALVLDSVDLTPFYSSKIKHGDYGDDNTIVEFNKMACCDMICSMDAETLRTIFIHLKEEIDKLVLLTNEE